VVLDRPAQFKMNHKLVEFVQDVDQAILVMRNAGRWLEESGKNPSKWWQLKNLNREFLFQYAEPREFYVALFNKKPAAAAILQINQKAQDWKSVDGNNLQLALYIHWLCVHREFAGKGLPKVVINFASKLAKKNNIKLLRADTNADEAKLCKIYEDLGFRLVATEQEDYRKTAFYQKEY